jgi:hypothetical protein
VPEAAITQEIIKHCGNPSEGLVCKGVHYTGCEGEKVACYMMKDIIYPIRFKSPRSVDLPGL